MQKSLAKYTAGNYLGKGTEMPKKVTIVSAVSLVLLIGLTALAARLAGLKGKKPSDVPSRVSVYDRAAGVIYTPGYEEVLAGCVEGLLMKNFEYEPEALKAVAIAESSRIKYFLKSKSGFEIPGADITVSEQLPYVREASAEVRAAAAYAVKYSLTFDGEPFNAPICRISSGRTDECPPYSPSVGLPCDVNAPGFESSTVFTPEEVRDALGGGNLSYNCIEWLHDPVYNDNGTLLFIGFAENKVSGETLRKNLKLRSSAVSAEYSGDGFVFECRGWGNNRGMSIYAANYLAKNGKTAEEILSVFYPEAMLSAN